MPGCSLKPCASHAGLSPQSRPRADARLRARERERTEGRGPDADQLASEGLQEDPQTERRQAAGLPTPRCSTAKVLLGTTCRSGLRGGPPTSTPQDPGRRWPRWTQEPNCLTGEDRRGPQGAHQRQGQGQERRAAWCPGLGPTPVSAAGWEPLHGTTSGPLTPPGHWAGWPLRPRSHLPVLVHTG